MTVERVELLDDAATRWVHVRTAAPEAACPSCGVFSWSVKENTTTGPRDLPYGEAPLQVRWHKRRWRCREPWCERKTFTESTKELPLGARLTGRLRWALADASEDNRCVARSHGVGWPTAQRTFDAWAAATAGEPAATPVLGVDETRRERACWRRDVDGIWRRTDLWETGFVDLAGGGGLLGQVPGWTSRCVVDWLEARSEAGCAAVRFVALDPSAPYMAAVRQALPSATIVVDHFHLVQLTNQTVTKVRQRVTQQTQGRRGRRRNPVWANRQLLLRGWERLSHRAFTRR